MSALSVLLAYLLGSVPFGLLLGLVVGRVDIRPGGSGNIGATNVGRALGRPWAVVAFGCDFAKGWVSSALLAPALVPAERVVLYAVLCGGAAVAGHCWPLYLRFRGGKGVATGCGSLVAIDPVVFLGGGLVWLAALGLFRMVGLASILMGTAFPVLAWFRGPGAGTEEGAAGGWALVCGALALWLLVILRHRANIARMLAGSEPRIGRGAPRAKQDS